MKIALFPGPAQLFVACSDEKLGRAWEWGEDEGTIWYSQSSKKCSYVCIIVDFNSLWTLVMKLQSRQGLWLISLAVDSIMPTCMTEKLDLHVYKGYWTIHIPPTSLSENLTLVQCDVTCSLLLCWIFHSLVSMMSLWVIQCLLGQCAV